MGWWVDGLMGEVVDGRGCRWGLRGFEGSRGWVIPEDEGNLQLGFEGRGRRVEENDVDA